MGDDAENEVAIQQKSAQEAPLSTHSVSSLRDVERPDENVFDSNNSKYISQNYRRAAGAAYVLAMGVCGIVLVALASSLKSLAVEVERTSIEIGAVFLTRGIGAALGNLVAPKLYLWARGKHVVSVALFLLAAFLLAVPLSDDVRTLHLNFLILGFLAAIIDAGCLLMTRRLHGSAAGPWLGANTVAFGVSGALSPLIGWLTGSLMVQYSVLAAVGFIIGFILVVLPRPGVQPPPSEEQIQVMPLTIPEGWSKPRAFYDANKIDFHLCGIMFWFMGGRIAATAFLREFVDDTSSASDAHILIVLLWLAITLGRVIGLRDQLTLALARLFRHVTILCVGGIVAMVVLLFFYRFTKVIWISVVVYGCFTGPALGYAYDLSTRVSRRPDISAMVAMFGITSGASIVPFLASFVWSITGLAFFLPLFLVASHAIPLVLLRDTRRLHGVVSIRRSSHIDASAIPTPTPTFGAPPSPTSCWSPTGSHFDEGSDDEGSRAVEGRVGGEDGGGPQGVEMSQSS